jgi:hypothetical protein
MFFCSFSYGEQKNILKLIENIPSEDRRSLEEFFQYLVKNEPIGYVIFGDKPMAWCGFYSNSGACICPRNQNFIPSDRVFENYLVWNSYKQLFQIKNFIFRIVKSKVWESQYDIIFVNKKTCHNVIHKNLKLFQRKLGRSITPDKIISGLESKDDILEDVLKGNEDLLGILLGFGIHNSQLFQKRQNLDKMQGMPPFDFDKVKEAFNIKMTGFPHQNNEDYLLQFIQLPHFIEDKNHPESIQVRKKYIEAQKKLCSIYCEGRFLEITLDKLHEL